MTSSHESTSPLTDAIVQLTGTSSNAYAILGRVRQAILHSNHPELTEVFFEEAASGDYAHLLATCHRYVTVE